MRGQRSETASATDSDVLRWVSSCPQAFAPPYLLVDALLLKPALCMYTIRQTAVHRKQIPTEHTFLPEYLSLKQQKGPCEIDLPCNHSQEKGGL